MLLIGTDQRITSEPAAITAALKGRILIRIVGGVPFARGLALWLTHQYALNRT